MGKRGIITIKSEGDLKYMNGFSKRAKVRNFRKTLEYFGQRGVEALALETPIDTGKTAMSWDYEIVEEDGRIELIWTNSSAAGDTSIPIVLLIQYGHGTRNGGYVAPYDFINPVVSEIFNEIANSVWREVTRK